MLWSPLRITSSATLDCRHNLYLYLFYFYNTWFNRLGFCLTDNHLCLYLTRTHKRVRSTTDVLQAHSFIILLWVYPTPHEPLGSIWCLSSRSQPLKPDGHKTFYLCRCHFPLNSQTQPLIVLYVSVLSIFVLYFILDVHLWEDRGETSKKRRQTIKQRTKRMLTSGMNTKERENKRKTLKGFTCTFYVKFTF